MNFEFATAGRIVFGMGTIARLGELAAGLGRRALVVTGRDSARAGKLMSGLSASGLGATTFSVAGEPEIATVENGVAAARKAACDCVIGFGGGSVIDTAKAIGAMLTNEGELLDYLEIVGRGQTLARRSAPVIAIPTTAGTGAEVTRNSVLASPAHHVKVSLRSPFLLPAVALVDPELTLDLPPALTASTGLDALTQLIEPYVCARANPLTDGFCTRGLACAARSLRAAVHHGHDRNAREDMAMASLLGGLALANAGLGAVHGFAGPIGGMFPAPHGAVCGALLPHVMRTNVSALRARMPDSPALRRYEQVAVLLTGDPHASADAGVEWVQSMVAGLPLARLGAYGIREEHVPAVVEKAARASSMKPNPIGLTAAELAGILRSAL